MTGTAEEGASRKVEIYKNSLISLFPSPLGESYGLRKRPLCTTTTVTVNSKETQQNGAKLDVIFCHFVSGTFV